MSWKKICCLGIAGILVSLYTTFVFQNLWNWFVVAAFNIPSIPFWGMYGFVLLVSLFSENGKEFIEEWRWKVALSVLDACVPQEKQEDVREMLKREEEGVVGQAVGKVFGKIAGNTVALALGWGIHTFLL